MPPSPPPLGHLFQERLAAEPFWMLVACCLVNLTTWAKAEDVFLDLRELHTVESLAEADPPSLHDVLRPLGLQAVRSARLVRMARAWLARRPVCAKDVLSLPGCGKYAADSWAVFVDGAEDVRPDDGKLTWYVEQLRRAA